MLPIPHIRFRAVSTAACALAASIAFAALAARAQTASSGETAGDETGFVTADGFAALPDTAPSPSIRLPDPEERAENDAADEAANEAAILADAGPEAKPSPDAADKDAASANDEPVAPRPDAPVYQRLAESDAEFEACTARLAELGAEFSPAPALTEARDTDCGIARPLSVTAIRPGVVMRPDALMRCDTAVALAEWTKQSVEPAAEALGRGAVSAIDHGSTYICRRRNNAATGKLSEHSFGNAVDVMAFRFADGDPLRIEPREGGPAGRFQARVREGSCDHFTTVLGPGSNAAHADHLHLDVKQRRGGYRLCE